jgi:hypothetical protein
VTSALDANVFVALTVTDHVTLDRAFAALHDDVVLLLDADG